MGDRFLFSRLAPLSRGQFNHALKHVGPATKQMRKELAEAVAGLFAGRRAEPQKINDDEIRQIDAVISLAVRLRGAVERDRHSREMESVLGAEGTARIGLSLERLLAGLDTIGVPRATAIAIVKTVALDSVPPLRLRAYDHLRNARRRDDFLNTEDFIDVETPTVAQALGLPTNTIRRVLEDLAAYGLIERRGTGAGKADKWIARQWEDLSMHPQKPRKTRDTVQVALRARIGACKKPAKHGHFLHIREPYPQNLSNSVKCKILYLTQRVDHSLTFSHTLTRFCGYGCLKAADCPFWSTRTMPMNTAAEREARRLTPMMLMILERAAKGDDDLAATVYARSANILARRGFVILGPRDKEGWRMAAITELGRKALAVPRRLRRMEK
jgi:hypothetical protein